MNHQDIFVFPPAGEHQPAHGVAFGVIRLAHSHIYSMCDGLMKAGGEMKYVYDPDKKHIAAFLKQFPWVEVCDSAKKQERAFRAIELAIEAQITASSKQKGA